VTAVKNLHDSTGGQALWNAVSDFQFTAWRRVAAVLLTAVPSIALAQLPPPESAGPPSPVPPPVLPLAARAPTAIAYASPPGQAVRAGVSALGVASLVLALRQRAAQNRRRAGYWRWRGWPARPKSACVDGWSPVASRARSLPNSRPSPRSSGPRPAP